MKMLAQKMNLIEKSEREVNISASQAFEILKKEEKKFNMGVTTQHSKNI